MQKLAMSSVSSQHTAAPSSGAGRSASTHCLSTPPKSWMERARGHHSRRGRGWMGASWNQDPDHFTGFFPPAANLGVKRTHPCLQWRQIRFPAQLQRISDTLFPTYIGFKYISKWKSKCVQKINFSWKLQKYLFTLVWQIRSRCPLSPPKFSFSPAGTHHNGWLLKTRSAVSHLYPDATIRERGSLLGHLHLSAPTSHHSNGREHC